MSSPDAALVIVSAEQVRIHLSELQEEIDRKPFLDFLNTIIESAPPLLASLRAAVFDNPTEAMFAAHKLRGTVGAVGAAVISDRLLAMEQALQRGDTAAAAEHLAPLEGLVDSLVLMLGTYH